jgi:hypothetical protein
LADKKAISDPEKNAEATSATKSNSALMTEDLGYFEFAGGGAKRPCPMQVPQIRRTKVRALDH